MVTRAWTASRTKPNWFPSRPVQATLDYSLDISEAIDPLYDIISFVSASVAPSGTGEAQVSNVQAAADIITLTLSGGVASRVYHINLLIGMFDGRVFDFLVKQSCPSGLRGYPVPYPPSPGFGAPWIWNFSASFDFTNPMNSAYVALLSGF